MFKKIVIKFLNFIALIKLGKGSIDQEAYLNDLRLTAKQTQVFEVKNCPPSEKEWFDNMNKLRILIVHSDPRKFLQWDVVKNTMFISYASYIMAELSSLKVLPDWSDRWSLAIRESPTGCPAPYIFYPASSANLIHHAYHLSVFEQRTARRIDDLDFVLEFGGGYGSMCRVFHKLGFQGRYVIYDLPLFSALQKFFLKSIGFNVLSKKEFLSKKSGIYCVSDMEELNSSIFHEDCKLESLFIATWSISESPVKIRDSIYPLAEKFTSWFIAYQYSFREVDNVNFFNSWKNRASHYKWENFPIKHMPGHDYLIGVKDSYAKQE